MRTEQEIFDDLAALCTSPGYAHAIAFFCFRDNIVGYKDELRGEDYAKLFSQERLIRTEISTLIGLMARAPIDYTLPSQKQFEEFIERTEALLKELHQAMMQPFVIDFHTAIVGQNSDPFETADAMREPIFYGPESAHSFQYRDLAAKKYKRDDEWLKQNKGFAIEDVTEVIRAIWKLQEETLLATVRGLKDRPPESWSLLDGFAFSPGGVVAVSHQPLELVNKVLSAFAFSDDKNPTFTSLHEFNATNAFPLLKVANGRYVLFQYMSLTEAVYDSPFYWMAADKAYEQSAMANRGIFTEEFAAERLERVFGKDNVFRNVDIWESKAKKLGEIDTLVLFANRAIVVQAKSKKLTLAARKGNDLQLKGDFKGAVQDACDQAFLCSQQVASASARFTDSAGKEIKMPASIKTIHLICLVADHYPALSFQGRQFLKYTTTEAIKAPLVCDVFFLDAVTEMLETPLRCLSYLELRAMAGHSVIFSHENTALGYHLRQNLWLGEYDTIQLEDDISIDLDIAMAVRRDGVEGERTPRGILTELRDLSVGRIVGEVEKRSDAGAVDLGLELLRLSGKSARDLSHAIDRMVTQAAKDSKAHDATLGFSKTGSGITVHCNNLPDPIAVPRLRRHCELRKYSQKASTWFGMIVSPGSGALRMGLVLDYPWTTDQEMDKVVEKMPNGLPPEALRHFSKGRSKLNRKIGRNERCPCGSMLKYKKCCLHKARE
jgi:hypothetical protein